MQFIVHLIIHESEKTKQKTPTTPDEFVLGEKVTTHLDL